MKFAGIIAEYDPFHNGHAAQIAMARARGAETVAVCISTGAVQRGGLPVWPEPVRVRAALEAGADLVAALPAPYACAGAELFAAAGVRLLTALGCDALVFGAEDPDAALLMETARYLRSPALDRSLRERLSTGMTYAAARAAAAERLRPGLGEVLRKPNNILGVEYCKAILAQNSPLQPCPLPRLGAAHGESGAGEWQGTPMASASLLRTLPLPEQRPFVPAAAFEAYCRAADEGLALDAAKLDAAALALLRARTDFSHLRGISEGLEHRLAAAVRQAVSLQDLYDRLTTKRYPHARLRRLVLDAVLDIPPELPPLPYLHILGARRAALPLLRRASLPVSTSLSDLRGTAETDRIVELHSRAVDFSSLCRVQTGVMGLAFTVKPVVL